jgi:hypothetical protein
MDFLVVTICVTSVEAKDEELAHSQHISASYLPD